MLNKKETKSNASPKTKEAMATRIVNGRNIVEEI